MKTITVMKEKENRNRMKIIRAIRNRAAMAALMAGTLAGAFLTPVSAYASEGENGAVYIDLPQGWQTQAATLQIKSTEAVVYTDNGDTYTSVAKAFYASIDDEGYKDVTDVQSVTIDHNCKLAIKAIYDDGNTVYNNYDIRNFDLECPTVTATVDGELLYLSAADEISGVKDISVNGKLFTELGAGQMCVNIKALEGVQEYIEIHSDDNAGNRSKEYKIRNPYYVGEIESGQEDKSLDNPDSVEATDPTRARGTVSDDTIVKEGDGTREFYTVEASGKTFYLIVDKTAQQDNVYLLTEAGVNDLLNFVDYNGVDVQNGNIPMYEIPTVKRDTEPEVYEEEKQDVKETKEKEKPADKGNSTTTFVIVVFVCLGGLIYYFMRNKKRKEELAEAEEMTSYTTPDDEVGIGDNAPTEVVDGDDDPGNDPGNDPDDGSDGGPGENDTTDRDAEAENTEIGINDNGTVSEETIPVEAIEGSELMPQDLIDGNYAFYEEDTESYEENSDDHSTETGSDVSEATDVVITHTDERMKAYARKYKKKRRKKR